MHAASQGEWEVRARRDVDNEHRGVEAGGEMAKETCWSLTDEPVTFEKPRTQKRSQTKMPLSPNR